jgi:heme ABC exporter ATP-binding subunit CcmA
VSPLDFESLTVTDLSRAFGRRRALHKATFRAAAGEIVGVLGPNGAGKSTLLGVLSTLLAPTSGEVVYGIHSTLAGAPLRARIGILGHDLFLYPELTAHENLAFFASLYQRADASALATKALSRAGLADRAHDPVSSFSRGMRQRVALERALIHDPRLALLDEPFTGLDDASTAALVARLRALRDGGTIVILATHDLELAEGLIDEAVFLREGRVASTMTRPERLRSTYRDVMGQS